MSQKLVEALAQEGKQDI